MSAAAIAVRAEEQPAYNEDVIRLFTIATMFWGVVGFAAGTFIAFQLAYPVLNLGLEWTTFGRLRPLHTSAVIFAFGGNALIGTSLWVVQRTCRAPLFGGRLIASFLFWGYQLFIVMAALGYVFGITQGREYAEPEWYVDLWLTVVWVLYLVVFFGTLLRRKEPHIYVANWFYLAFIVTIAMLHIVNNLAVPVSFFGVKSYSLFAGVQDALTQWWYGHNAVGFFLTAGFLGMMYYFVPKQADRPVYSYRLSIIHFWALIFLYIWAGPHHLHYTALPDWAQVLGMTFSIMLWMPSWGGMINGLMTLSGAWDKLRTDPVLRFLVVSIAFYGMSTFEGPLMSIRQVNALSHYTDWTVGHVHSGALGWVGFVSFGAVYYLVPRSVEGAAPLLPEAGRVALLGRDHGHRALHHRDVGVRHHAGPDVALVRPFGLPAVFVRRDGAGDAPLLRDPRLWRRAVPHRRPDHGLQSLAHRPRRRPRRGRDLAAARLRPHLPRPSEEQARCRCCATTRRSRPAHCCSWY